MNHKNLEVWKKGMDLVVQVNQITNMFPDTEKFGLTSQMRRAAVSIPSNIAEGAARKSDKEFIQFLYIALGFLAEVETQYLIAIRLQYLNEDLKVDNSFNEVKSLIIGMKNYLLKK